MNFLQNTSSLIFLYWGSIVSELGPEEKEQLNQLWEVIKKPKAEDGYKNISKSLNMLWSTVKSIITKWESMALLWIYLEHTVLKKLSELARSLVILHCNLMTWSHGFSFLIQKFKQFEYKCYGCKIYCSHCPIVWTFCLLQSY